MMWARLESPLRDGPICFCTYSRCGGQYLSRQVLHTKPMVLLSLKLGVGEKPKGRLPRPSYHPQYLAHQKHFFSRGISFGSHLGCVCLHCQENASLCRGVCCTSSSTAMLDMASAGYAWARKRYTGRSRAETCLDILSRNHKATELKVAPPSHIILHLCTVPGSPLSRDGPVENQLVRKQAIQTSSNNTNLKELWRKIKFITL